MIKITNRFVYGDALNKLYQYAKEKQFALPAVNVISTSSINAALEAAKEAHSPIIIQLSYSGASFFIGKAAGLSDIDAAVHGSATAARYIKHAAKVYNVPVIIHTDHASKPLLPWIDGLLEAGKDHFEHTGQPLFSSHMLDLSEESLEENIKICAKYLTKMKDLNMSLEIELGCTGGEEDGADNTHINNAKLYTQPEDMAYAYEKLIKISPNFTIAASFGNVHGVYKSGQVSLRPQILDNSQKFVTEKFGLAPKPLNFVFHGNSGSDLNQIKEAISYGTIKMNIDTDMQSSYWLGNKEYSLKNSDYLQSQLGNPAGVEQPNKKYYDPRVSSPHCEQSTSQRLVKCFEDLNCTNRDGIDQ